jgi:hypothetical protein
MKGEDGPRTGGFGRIEGEVEGHKEGEDRALR